MPSADGSVGPVELSGVGIWSSQLRYGDPAESAEAAAELEELGYAALWIPDVGGPVFDSVAHLLASTTHTVIATGILNLWMHEPIRPVAASYTSLTKTHGERFLLGIGLQPRGRSSTPLNPAATASPLAATRSFLDALDAAEQPVPRREPGARGARPEDAGTGRDPDPAAPIRTSAHPSTPTRPRAVSWATVPLAAGPSKPSC